MKLIQICSRTACKIACFCRQKYMQLAGKNTKMAGKNTRKRRQEYPQSQAKIHAICGQQYPQSQATIPAIAGKLTRNCR